MLPELKLSNHSVKSIALTRIVSANVSKHEYALIFTFSRLLSFSIDRYNAAINNQKSFLESQSSLGLSSLINFSSNLECFIDYFHRSLVVLDKLLKDYPEYQWLLPKKSQERINMMKDVTYKVRNTIQHIDGVLIGDKFKDPKKMGSIVVGLNNKNEFILADTKIPIARLLTWVEEINKYSEYIANYDVEKAHGTKIIEEE